MEQHNNKYSITLNDEVVFLIKDNNNNNNNNYNTINNNENNENNEDNNNNKPKLYKRRYLALVLFSLLTMFQSNLWMTYSSVADTAMDIYGIGKSQINMLAAFGAIAFIPLSFVSSWAIDNLGLRKSTVIAALAVGGGAVVRSLAVRDSLFALVYIGQFANAAAGPILMTTSPVLSAAWFGPHERTLATGLCTTANNMGIPIGFLISTFVSTRKQFFYMLWIEAAAAVMITILIILFVVDKPPSPPSFSKQINSVNEKISMVQFLKDTWKVLSDRNCFILIMAVTFTAGGNAGWSSMLIMILTPLKFTENQAQWIGFISGSIGLIGGIFIGKFHDKYKNYKWILIVLFLVSTLGYLYFTLATTSILLQFYKTPYWAMLLVITVGNFCLNALYPIGYEALSELSFPVSETVGSGTLSLMINIGCLIYLIFGDYVPISWNNWILVGCCGFACTITLFLKEQYKRLSVDDKMH